MIYCDADPAVYPAFDIYRSGQGATLENWREPRSNAVIAVYPNLDICKFVPLSILIRTQFLAVLDPAVYPAFDIYQSGYPSVLENWREPKPVTLPSSYPNIDICKLIHI